MRKWMQIPNTKELIEREGEGEGPDVSKKITFDKSIDKQWLARWSTYLAHIKNYFEQIGKFIIISQRNKIKQITERSVSLLD